MGEMSTLSAFGVKGMGRVKKEKAEEKEEIYESRSRPELPPSTVPGWEVKYDRYASKNPYIAVVVAEKRGLVTNEWGEKDWGLYLSWPAVSGKFAAIREKPYDGHITNIPIEIVGHANTLEDAIKVAEQNARPIRPPLTWLEYEYSGMCKVNPDKRVEKKWDGDRRGMHDDWGGHVFNLEFRGTPYSVVYLPTYIGGHLEFHTNGRIISETGYFSHFFNPPASATEQQLIDYIMKVAAERHGESFEGKKPKQTADEEDWGDDEDEDEPEPLPARTGLAKKMSKPKGGAFSLGDF